MWVQGGGILHGFRSHIIRNDHLYLSNECADLLRLSKQFWHKNKAINIIMIDTHICSHNHVNNDLPSYYT